MEVMCMGLFSFLSQMKKAKSAGGNFGFIAQNIGAIYTALGKTEFGKSLSESEKLYATGLIDTFAYLQQGTLTPRDIAMAMAYGTAGEVCLNFYRVQHGNAFFKQEKNEELIDFTMALEAKIFEVSNTGVDYRSLVDLVVENKQTISDMINKTLAEGENCNIYREVMSNVVVHAASPAFQEIVKNYNFE